VKEIVKRYRPEDFTAGGQVEFALGAEPHTGAFVMAFNDHPEKMKYMSYFKFGEGPLYMFYTPYHLPHMQLPHTVARAVLFKDPTLAPRGAPVCDTVSMAKRDLRAGERLDGMGGFTCYGLIDSYENCRRNDDLPIALSLDCVLKRDVAKDQPISYRDVELPAGRLCDKLRAEQTSHFAATLRKAA
jgi:predicted homoserine dehydrogenase-like protein